MEVHVETHDSTRLTGSPTVYKDTVYVPVASWEETRSGDPEYPCCTFRGSVAALRIRDGKQLWKTYMTGFPWKTARTRAASRPLDLPASACGHRPPSIPNEACST